MIELCALSRLLESVDNIFSSLVQYVGDADSDIQGSEVVFHHVEGLLFGTDHGEAA
jgi:hypothetical protein